MENILHWLNQFLLYMNKPFSSSIFLAKYFQPNMPCQIYFPASLSPHSTSHIYSHQPHHFQFNKNLLYSSSLFLSCLSFTGASNCLIFSLQTVGSAQLNCRNSVRNSCDLFARALRGEWRESDLELINRKYRYQC